MYGIDSVGHVASGVFYRREVFWGCWLRRKARLRLASHRDLCRKSVKVETAADVGARRTVALCRHHVLQKMHCTYKESADVKNGVFDGAWTMPRGASVVWRVLSSKVRCMRRISVAAVTTSTGLAMFAEITVWCSTWVGCETLLSGMAWMRYLLLRKELSLLVVIAVDWCDEARNNGECECHCNNFCLDGEMPHTKKSRSKVLIRGSTASFGTTLNSACTRGSPKQRWNRTILSSGMCCSVAVRRQDKFWRSVQSALCDGFIENERGSSWSRDRKDILRRKRCLWIYQMESGAYRWVPRRRWCLSVWSRWMIIFWYIVWLLLGCTQSSWLLSLGTPASGGVVSALVQAGRAESAVSLVAPLFVDLFRCYGDELNVVMKWVDQYASLFRTLLVRILQNA